MNLDLDASSPDQIHTALTVVHRRSWVAPIVLGLVILGALGFMLVGRIPVTAKGKAMFLSRGKVIPFQSTANGQLKAWKVKVGDTVRKGDVLAVISQPELEKQLDQARQQLKDLQARNKESDQLSGRFTELELQSVAQKGELLRLRIQTLEEQLERNRVLTDENQDRKTSFLVKQERGLRDLVKVNEARANELAQRLEKSMGARTKGLQSADDVLRSQRSLTDQEQRVADLALQLAQVRVKRAEAAEAYLDALQQLVQQEEQIGTLRAQLEGLENRKAQIEQADRTADYQRNFQAADLERAISRHERQLAENANILADHDGRVLELTVGEGNVVSRGVRLGAIDTRKPGDPLEAVTYCTLADGKKVRPGMAVRLTPATVERERFGSLLAEVVEVTDFPVTQEGAAKTVGIATVAQELTQGGRQIEIYARLLPDPDAPDRFQWDTTDGPEFELTSGTVADALVNVAANPPLTFVIPSLNDWKGL